MGVLLRNSFKWLRDWWRIVHYGAVVLVLLLSPSTYRGGRLAAIARNIYAGTWQVLPWFTVLCTLVSLVLIHIVVVTAASYGLSQYALEVVVRVLVLELIPLGATLFVVLRSGIAVAFGQPAWGGRVPAAADASPARIPQAVPERIPNPTQSAQPASDPEDERVEAGVPLRQLAGMVGSAFSVVTLAFASCVLALVLAYCLVYGLSPWGFSDYTQTVGRIFDASTSLLFGVKVLLFSLAVAVIPVASASLSARQSASGGLPAAGDPSTVDPSTGDPVDGAPVTLGTVRLFLALLLVEASCLALKYA